MAEEGTFCVNGDVVRKAGHGASSTAIAEAYTNVFIKDAESEINAATRKNWHDEFATLTTEVKQILRQAASDKAAIYVINYNMGGYNSAREAEAMVNILNNNYNRALVILREMKVQTFMLGDT